MKIKQIFDDFIVDEIANFTILDNSNYQLFLLKKRGIDTLEAIKAIASKYSISLNDVGYAGIKDKHGVTSQYISLPKNILIKETFGVKYSLKFLGFIENKIKIGDLDRNKFTLVVRDLTKENIEKAKLNIEKIAKFGFPNYFDSQRFGSIVQKEFIGKYVLEKNFEKAVKMFLLNQYLRVSKKEIKFDEFNLMIKNFEKNFTFPYYEFLKTEFLSNKSWSITYKKIPTKQRELFITAYQSFLWNEVLNHNLVKFYGLKNLVFLKYKAGNYSFLKNLDKQFSVLDLPLIGRGLSENDCKKYYTEILKKENLVFDDFVQVSKSGNFLKSPSRKAFSIPVDLKIIEVGKDDLNKEGFKMKLSFELEKGAYATILVRSIFLKNPIFG